MSEKQLDQENIQGEPDSPNAIAAKDPHAPSAEVSAKKQSLSDIFTIVSSSLPTPTWNN